MTERPALSQLRRDLPQRNDLDPAAADVIDPRPELGCPRIPDLSRVIGWVAEARKEGTRNLRALVRRKRQRYPRDLLESGAHVVSLGHAPAPGYR